MIKRIFVVTIILMFSFILILASQLVLAQDSCNGCEYNGECHNVGYEFMVGEIPSYCDISGGILSQRPDGEVCDNDFECVNNLCSNSECVNLYGEVGGRREVIGDAEEILVGENKKDTSMYSDKEIFLISDKNWRDVLSLVPVTTWTQQEGDDADCQRGYGTPDNVCVYPTLIYHEEENSFDADSIIYFMQQYSPDKVTILGETPKELINLIEDENIEFGAQLGDDATQEFGNVLSYWDSYQDVVYVEDDYELALMASTYASLINAPLIIQGTELDGDVNFERRNIICVKKDETILNRNCNHEQTYNLEQLQQKYVDETNTDKIILVNPNDLNIVLDIMNDILYVEADRDLFLLSLTYSSLINAPLIVQGTSEDTIDVFFGKNVICIGSVSPSGSSCNEQYTLEQLQQKYDDERYLPRNDDVEKFKTEKSGDFITELYGKTSLVAPILASAKHEIILSTTSNTYQDVDYFIESKINELGLNVEYLTIIATPDSIPNTFIGILEKVGDYGWYSNADSFFYSDIDNDIYSDLAVGRIYGLTTADVSSYISRDLFYNQIPNSNNYFSYHRAIAQGWGIPGEELSNINLFKSAGFNYDDLGIITYFSTNPTPDEILNNKAVIDFWIHGGQTGVAGLTTSDITNNKLWLNPSLVIANACSTCAYTSPAYHVTSPEDRTKLFCMHMLRRGALAYIGAIDVSNFNIAKPVISHLFIGKTIGQAFRDAKNDLYTTSLGRLEYWRLGDMAALFGDPTFNFNFNYPGNIQRVSSNNYINAQNQLVVEINIPEINKIEDPDPNVVHNYFEAPIGREATSIINRVVLNGVASEYSLLESYTFDPIELGDYKIDKVNHLNIENVDIIMVPTAPSGDFLEKLGEISGLGKTVTEEMNKEVMNAVYPGVSPDGIVYHNVGWIKDPDKNEYNILFTREKWLQLNEIELPESIPAKTYKIYFDLR